jgi:GTPase SAR1 family protein
MLGLDNAGKTLPLHRLRTGDIRLSPPTDRPHHVDAPYLQGFSSKLGIWEVTKRYDTCGRLRDGKSIGRLVLVDVADTERLKPRTNWTSMLADLPVAILLNKCDMPNAMTESEVCERIESFKALQDARPYQAADF